MNGLIRLRAPMAEDIFFFFRLYVLIMKDVRRLTSPVIWLHQLFWIFRKYSTFSRKPVVCYTRWGKYYGLLRCWGPVASSKMVAILGAIFCLHFLHFSTKKTHFSSKMAWPPATYDVISGSHRNWFSPNLCQNVSKGYAHSYWKRQV